MTGRAVWLAGLLLLADGGCSEEGAPARLPQSQPAATGKDFRAAGPASRPTRPPVEQASGEGERSARDQRAPGPRAATPLLSGTLEPHRRSVLAASVTGPVARVFVREGEMVRAGQPLVALNSEGFRLGLRQAEASLSSARAQLEAARVDYQRLRALLEDSAIPRRQFEAAESRFKVARAGHRAALVGLEQARKSLRDSVVRAPYAGLVVKRHVSEGDYATSLPPTELITLEEIDILDLRVQVPSSDSAHFRVGSWARARFPGIGEEVRVRIVRVVGSLDPRTRTFAAIAEIRNPGGKLRPGLYAQVLPDVRGRASPAGPE